MDEKVCEETDKKIDQKVNEETDQEIDKKAGRSATATTG